MNTDFQLVFDLDTSLISPPPPTILDREDCNNHFHNDDSNMNFDIIWDDRPDVSSTPISRSKQTIFIFLHA